MKTHPMFGQYLALGGVLVLTPDTLFMRLSDMTGLQMLAWRGVLMGGVLLVGWCVAVGAGWRSQLPALFSIPGAVVIFGYAINAAMFSFGIATSPVLVVLLGVSTVPVFASIFAWLIAGETTGRSTWMTTVAVIAGIGISVFSFERSAVGINIASLRGAIAGLGVAVTLALCFVTIRKTRALPVAPAIGLGALLSGFVAMALIGPARALDGQIWAIAVCGAVLLPISFLAMTTASRHTPAANVSLIMLLETILGPIWVWIGLDESPTPLMLAGGAIVLVSLAVYIVHSARQIRRIAP